MKKDYINKVADKLNIKNTVPKEELTKFCARSKKITIKKDEYFLRAGEIPERIGFNLGGLLRLYYINENGTEVVKHFCVEN